MKDISGLVFLSPEDDVGDTGNSRVFSNSSPSRWLKGELMDTGQLLASKQALIDGSFDRILRIEIVSGYDTLDSFSDLVKPWNQMTIDTGKNYSEVAIPVSTEEDIVDCNQAVIEDGFGCENGHEDAVGRTQDKISEFIFAACNDSNLTMNCTTTLGVQTLHICSPLLDAESPFALNSFSDLVKPWNQMTIDTRKNYSEVAIPISTEKHIVDCKQAVIEDGFGCENGHKDAVGRTQEIISACNDSNLTMKCTTEVQTLHICSPLLEAKSPFFRKLFSNGMSESAQLTVTLRINPSEKAALLELLGFMHTDTLGVTTAPALLDVLVIADKFEVTKCMSVCCQMLLNFPVTYESSLLYLGLASGVLMSEVVQPLIVAAKEYLAVTFGDISKSADEIMKLPLVGIETVFASDELRVASEDVLFDLMLKWSRMHYPEFHERKDILTHRLSPLLRFPFMSFRKLDEVLECPDMDPVFASKFVVKALHFKVKALFHQQVLTKGTNHHLVPRRYKYQVVKIIHYAFPMQKCVVFMDLKRKDCEELFTTGRMDSEIIHLGGQGFFLSAHCNLDPQRSYPCFGMFLGKVEKGSPSSSIKYEFSAMMSSSEEYACDHKGYCILPRGKAVGYRNFFGLHWKDFISDDFLFINDVLHVKCVLTM